MDLAHIVFSGENLSRTVFSLKRKKCCIRNLYKFKNENVGCNLENVEINWIWLTVISPHKIIKTIDYMHDLDNSTFLIIPPQKKYRKFKILELDWFWVIGTQFHEIWDFSPKVHLNDILFRITVNIIIIHPSSKDTDIVPKAIVPS